MWTVIDGLAGSGKTWLQTRLARKGWLRGADIWANYNINFGHDNDGVNRYNHLDEIFHLTKAILVIDDAQKLAGYWQGMPITFRDKIAEHRHDHLDVLSTTQDFMNMHIQIRRNVHLLYRCQSLFRFPPDDRVKPIIQWIRVIKKERRLSDNADSIRFRKVGRARWHFISRFWTKIYYDTYENLSAERFICKLKYLKKPQSKEGEWLLKIYDKDLINSGRARI